MAPVRFSLLTKLLLLCKETRAWTVGQNNNRAIQFCQHGHRHWHRRKTGPTNRGSTSLSSQLGIGGYQEPSKVRGDAAAMTYDHMIFGVPCVERRIIDLIPDENVDDPFVVLDILENNDDRQSLLFSEKDDRDKEDDTLMMLAKYLVDNRNDLIRNRKVVVIGSSWISILVARLGAISVVAWDGEPQETRLKILQNTDQFINSCRNSSIHKCRIETTTDGEGLCTTADPDIIILTTNKSSLDCQMDYFVNDELRRTDATVILNAEVKEGFSYWQRINEGLDIILW